MDTTNYQAKEVTVGVLKTQFIALALSIPLVALYCFAYCWIWGNYEHNVWTVVNFVTSYPLILICLVVLVLGTNICELIFKGLVFARYAAKGWKSIKLGIMWDCLSPYCHCKEPIMLRHYIVALLLPGVVFGIIPAVVALVIGHPIWLLLGVFYTIAAGNDMLTAAYLLRKAPAHHFVKNHPSRIGCYIFSPNNNI
ncbi:hypothetical protein FACS1894156_3720 [Bacteroidia bacterium]|nr:hypothetical protein FACS1894156_3720 [Bacteroidia bacterium]